MRTKRHLLTAMLVIAIALSACGSDDSASSATDEVAETSDSGASEPGATDPGDVDSGDTEPDAPSGSDGGTVTIDGAEYTFGAEFACIFNEDFIVMQGPGTGPDGGPFWVDLDIDITRDDTDGDGERDAEIFVSVRGGVTENGQGAPAGQPDFYADNSGGNLGLEVILERFDDSVSGSGFMTNYDDIAADELIPFEFEGSCS